MEGKLDFRTEEKLRALSGRTVLRAALLTGLWDLFILGLWIGYALSQGRSLFEPTSALVALLMLLPFWPFHAHKVLFGKTYYATVKAAKVRDVYKTSMVGFGGRGFRSGGRINMTQVCTLTLSTDDGDMEWLEVYGKNAVYGYYRAGDRVLKVKGLPYPVKCPISREAEFLCPRCGNYVSAGARRCSWCRAEI